MPPLNVFGIFVNDTWNWGQVTMNIGARFDSYKGWLPEQAQLGGTNGPFTLPAQTFAELDQYTWNSFAPRVGLIYDFSGQGRTVIKANYGLFWHNPGVTLGSDANPNIAEKFVTYNWNDANGNRRYDAGETVRRATAQQVSGTISLNPDVKQPLHARGRAVLRAAAQRHDRRPRRVRLQDRRRPDRHHLPRPPR